MPIILPINHLFYHFLLLNSQYKMSSVIKWYVHSLISFCRLFLKEHFDDGLFFFQAALEVTENLYLSVYVKRQLKR